MGGCVSCNYCCGKAVEGAADVYNGIAVALPWLHLPKGETTYGEGLLIVRILRDKGALPGAPSIYIKDGDQLVQLYNAAGNSGDVPENLTRDVLKTLHDNPATGAQSMFVMMLVKGRDVSKLELVVDFPKPKGDNTTAGPNAYSYKMSLSDPTVVLSTDSKAAFGSGMKDDISAFHPRQIKDGPKFSMSVVRYNVFPNQRYPYNKPELQALIEGTRDSDFNPYPKPINHITDNGKQWINWGQTLSSRPDRVYSDGAMIEGEDKPRHPSPRTLDDCRAIIAYAREKKLNVRVFGSNHSWAPLSSTSGVLVDNRQLNCVVPSPGFDPLNNGKAWPGYSMTLNPKDELSPVNGPTVTFPPGICTGDLERWIKVNGDYRMPTSTVEDVFTMGGILATSCHGTGKNNPTCSDWVCAMEYIDWEGNLQKITRKSCDKKYLKKVQLKPGDPSSEVQLTEEDVFHAMLCNLGSFGIIWSYTMRVYPPAPVYLIAKTIPWKDLFDDTEEARDRFAKLQAQYETFECFYFPFCFTGKVYPVYEENPHLYVWLGGTTPPQGVNVYEPTDDEMFGSDLVQHMGVFMLHKLFLNATTNPMLYALMPYLASMMFMNLLLTVDKTNKPCAWKIPQWRSSHPFNAIGSVEGVPCCDIEWTLPMNVKQGAAGFLHPNRSYGDLIRALHAAHQSSSNPFDMARYPVTITVEMRIFHGSGALLSPQYYENFNVDDLSTGRAYCAPEIVTHAGNAGWDKFYKEQNAIMTDPKNAHRYGPVVRTHQAKEFSTLPGMLKFLRASYRAEKYKKSNPFDYFCAVRDAIDPTRMFVNPYLQQWLYSDNPEYHPPENLPIFTRGQIQKLDPRFKKLDVD